MKKVIHSSLLACFLTLVLSFAVSSNVLAATNASTHTVTAQPSAVQPNSLTVYCWLPHDIEVTNPDGVWCISGSGSVDIYNVTKIVNVSSSTHYITDDTSWTCYPIAPGATDTYPAPGHHIVGV